MAENIGDIEALFTIEQAGSAVIIRCEDEEIANLIATNLLDVVKFLMVSEAHQSSVMDLVRLVIDGNSPTETE